MNFFIALHVYKGNNRNKGENIMLKSSKLLKTLLIALFLFLINSSYMAHCDSMEGPVIKASKKALDTGNLNYVLVWIKGENEEVIKTLFNKVNNDRSLNQDAKELAEMHFFETIVRLHRSGEGEPYSGIKPVGFKLEDGIEEADNAIETGSLKNVLKKLDDKYHAKANQLFKNLQLKKKYDVNDVNSGRMYVESYVSFIHYIEELFKGENHSNTKHIH